MRFVVAIDQGTTGTTVLVLDRRGRVAGRAYREFTQHFPKPGWVEHEDGRSRGSLIDGDDEAHRRARSDEEPAPPAQAVAHQPLKPLANLDP